MGKAVLMSLLWLDCRAGKAVYSCGEGTGLLLGPKAAAPSGSGSAPGTEDEAGATPGCSQAARKPLGLTLRIQGSSRWRKGDSGLPPPPPPPPLSGRGRGRAWPVATSVPGSLTHTQPLGGLLSVPRAQGPS